MTDDLENIYGVGAPSRRRSNTLNMKPKTFTPTTVNSSRPILAQYRARADDSRGLSNYGGVQRNMTADHRDTNNDRTAEFAYSSRTPVARVPLHHSQDNEYGAVSSVGGGDSRRRLANNRRSNSQDLNFGAGSNSMRYHEGGMTTTADDGPMSVTMRRE